MYTSRNEHETFIIISLLIYPKIIKSWSVTELNHNQVHRQQTAEMADAPGNV